MITYPNDWEESKLLDHVDLVQGLTYTPENVKSYGTLVLRSSNIQNGKLSLNDNVYVNAHVPEEKMVQPGDILVCVRNGSSALIGKSCVLPKLNHTTFGAFMSVLRGDTTGYFAKVFESNIVQEQVRGRSNATINQITKKDFQSIMVTVPSEPEQEEIARTLSYFDTYIDDISELIEKKRGIREGALEDLTSGHTRLSGFKGDWEIIELGKKCEITSSKRVFEKEWTKSGITFLRTRDIASFHSGEEQNDKLYISEETYKEKIASSGEPKKGDLLVTGVGTIGLPFLIDTDEKIYFKDGNILWIKKNEMLTSEWLYFLFLSKAVQKQIADNSGFTTVGTFTIKNAKKLRVPMPSIPEQKAITSALTSMNDEIRALEAERDKMIQIREGAMDGLLTGRVRLSV